ncbi:MAG: bactofilin family protein [Bacteroidota bacterium]
MLRKLTKGSPGLGGAAGRPAIPVSIIGADVRIVGNIITQGEMQIDGQVEGDIACARLIVGEGGRIVGEVTADTVRVHGRLDGRIHANAVTIAKSAEVVGDITHDTLEIEAGGRLEGHLIRKGSQPATATPQLAAPKPAVAESELPTAEAAQ